MKKNLIIVMIGLLLFVTPVLADDLNFSDLMPECVNNVMNSILLFISLNLFCYAIGLVALIIILCGVKFNHIVQKSSNDRAGMIESEQLRNLCIFGFAVYMIGITVFWCFVKLMLF